MKYGKAVAQSLMPLKIEDFNFLTHKANEIAHRLGLHVAVTKHGTNDKNNAYFVEAKFTPTEWKEGMMRDPQTQNRLKLLGHDTPYIRVEIMFYDSQIEGTTHRVNQYHCYISTHNLLECEYKCRRFESYSKYKSFEYDTEIREIMSFVGCQVATIYQAYHLLFWV